MGKSNLHETIRSVAGLFTIALGVVYLAANPSSWPLWAIHMGWITVFVGIALLISGQQTWLRSILGRVQWRRWTVQPKAPVESDDGHFYAICELFDKAKTPGTADQMPSRKKLKQFGEWPDIARFSCQLFGDASFTRSTWEQLKTWLMDRSCAHWNRVITTQRSIVLELLREAVADKQKTGAFPGVTNQELRLWLPAIKATISSNAGALQHIRDRITERGVVDSAVRNLLAEKSSDAGDVLDRLGCLLANGPMFSE